MFVAVAGHSACSAYIRGSVQLVFMLQTCDHHLSSLIDNIIAPQTIPAFSPTVNNKKAEKAKQHLFDICFQFYSGLITVTPDNTVQSEKQRESQA